MLGGPRILGPVTPLGGLALIAGWISLLWLVRADRLARAHVVAVPVPVVQVRPVRVRVDERFVAMPVAVAHVGREARVRVVVMPVVVAVLVHVLELVVDVIVLVLRPQQRRDRRAEQGRAPRAARR